MEPSYRSDEKFDVIEWRLQAVEVEVKDLKKLLLGTFVTSLSTLAVLILKSVIN